MCPVYGQISAGQPNWAEECIEGRLMLDPDLMGIVNPEEHFFLRVNGESMNQVVRNGAFALIHKQDTIENGEIAVVLVNKPINSLVVLISGYIGFTYNAIALLRYLK